MHGNKYKDINILLNTFKKYGLELEIIKYNCINKNKNNMSDFKHKAGSGSIFKNKYKEKETHPDYRGKVVLQDGEEKDIALWIKESSKGGKFFSVAISNPYVKDSTDEAVKAVKDLPQNNLNDGLPF